MKASLYAIRSRNNGHVKKVKLSGLKQNNRDLLHKIREKRLENGLVMESENSKDKHI